MRDIKFRAWGKNSHEFISANGLDRGLTMKNIQALEDIDSWKLQQYTGLKDKNGKEIYEGDILETPRYKFEVVFNKGCFMAKQIRPSGEDWLCFISQPSEDVGDYFGTETVEVIGNIYESPEMLGDKS